jgi:hypothetical protein
MAAHEIRPADAGSGSSIYGIDANGSTSHRSFPQRITGLFSDYPYVFVQLAGIGTQVLSYVDDFRNVQTIPNIGAFDTAREYSFAGTTFRRPVGIHRRRVRA